MIEYRHNNSMVRLFASKTTWMEGEAVRQLDRTARLEGMEIVAGMPDMHPGRGYPIGAAFLSRRIFYPYLIGNDIGCGMGLYKTSLSAKKIKRDYWVKRLTGLDDPWEENIGPWLAENDLAPGPYDGALGTIGGGNHFAELQIVEKIFSQEAFSKIGLAKDQLVLLVHSGSRGMGNALLKNHTAQYGVNGLCEGTEAGVNYLKPHDEAIKWARMNRSLIAYRMARQLGTDSDGVLDVCHNSVSSIEIDGRRFWLHRKGAAPSDACPVVVPGSRGSLSYLVCAVGKQENNLWSLAHGAGRKWNRSSCKKRLETKFTAKALSHTQIGGRVICENDALLYEEAPQAYKGVDSVIADMEKDGLIHKIAAFRPLITYKTRVKK